MSTYNTTLLAELGFGDITDEGETVEMTDAEVRQLAARVAGTAEFGEDDDVDALVAEIESAQVSDSE